MTQNENPLVSTRWLSERLADPDVRVVGATVHLEPGPEGLRAQSGRAEHDAGHIPGAGFLDLIEELADPSSDLAFTRPPRDRVERALSRAGISREHHVVTYGASSDMWATRLWWILHASGLTRLSLLDGGLQKWKAEGRPLCSEPGDRPPEEFRAELDEERWATRQEVLDSIQAGGTCTINALPRAIHRGDAGLGYARPGHITGSENVPFSDLVDAKTGSFLEPDELRRHFARVGALERDRVITYCGGGIAATLGAFALALVGQPNVGVYDGSLSEWARDASLPMQTGD